MLAAEFTFAVAPATVRYDGGNARVDAGGVNRDGAAETGADHADAVARDGGVLRQKRERIAGVFHLLEADHPPVLAFAFAAAAHVEAQRDVAQALEDFARRQHVL